MKRTIVFSSCGTSILTNQATKEISSLLWKHANELNLDKIPQFERDPLNNHIDARKQKVISSSESEIAELSAELNGILSYSKSIKNQNIEHIILSTDTFLGRTTAETIRDWLISKGFSTSVELIKDLNTSSTESFQSGAVDIIKWCEDTFPGYRKSQYHIVFNLTGGFKSVQGLLQILAMIYADETVYVFQGGTLLRIPRLPVQLDFSQEVRNNFYVMRKLAVLKVTLPTTETAPISDTLLLRIDDQAAISVWGEAMWEREHRSLYEEKIWQSPCEEVKFGPRFLDSTSPIAPDRKRHINERIDDLCHYMRSNRTQTLKSLDVKQIKGGKHGDSTHECDAWADQDAKRIFFHYEGNIAVLDKLDRALH